MAGDGADAKGQGDEDECEDEEADEDEDEESEEEEDAEMEDQNDDEARSRHTSQASQEHAAMRTPQKASSRRGPPSEAAASEAKPASLKRMGVAFALGDSPGNAAAMGRSAYARSASQALDGDAASVALESLHSGGGPSSPRSGGKLAGDMGRYRELASKLNPKDILGGKARGCETYAAKRFRERTCKDKGALLLVKELLDTCELAEFLSISAIPNIMGDKRDKELAKLHSRRVEYPLAWCQVVIQALCGADFPQVVDLASIAPQPQNMKTKWA